MLQDYFLTRFVGFRRLALTQIFLNVSELHVQTSHGNRKCAWRPWTTSVTREMQPEAVSETHRLALPTIAPPGSHLSSELSLHGGKQTVLFHPGSWRSLPVANLFMQHWDRFP